MASQTQTSLPVKVDIFISYSHEDKDYMEELKKHLKLLERQGLVSSWTDTEIKSGAKWSQQIKEKLDNAHIILFLVSPDFVNSDYIDEVEITQAIKRYEEGNVIIIPIFVRFYALSGHPLLDFQGLPEYSNPVSNWSDQDKAWAMIVKELKVHIEDFQKKKLR